MLRHFLAALLLTVWLAPPVAAETPRQLDWDSLVPPAAPIENPFTHLTPEQLYDLEALVQIRSIASQQLISQVDPVYEEGVEIEYSLKRQGLDVERLVAQYEDLVARYEALNRSVVTELDGQLVRIPGYALPLEFDGTGVDEMLLVPYVGACIHVPPPPANQIVLVKLNQTYLADDLFEPVWITGRMRVQSSSASLFLIDGTADIDVGYVLEGTRVEPYE